MAVNARKVEFHAALLELGGLNTFTWMGLKVGGEPQAWRFRTDRTEFNQHRHMLLIWLEKNKVVQVYDRFPDPESPAMIQAESHACTKWVGEFYFWMHAMQGVSCSER